MAQPIAKIALLIPGPAFTKHIMQKLIIPHIICILKLFSRLLVRQQDVALKPNLSSSLNPDHSLVNISLNKCISIGFIRQYVAIRFG